MIAISLQSGSNGNCIYVEGNGTGLLFDAGICGREARSRLRSHGRDIRRVDAVIVSHAHTDHVRSAGVFQRMFGLPLYITRTTFEGAARRIGPVESVHYFRAGQTMRFGGLSVETISTPHDAPDSVAFLVTTGRKRLGILTDLGHVFKGLGKAVASLDAVFIESNYDPEMLQNGPYPRFLKERIRGPGGHISNVESAELLRDCAGGRLKWACLAHLSENNNDPDTALHTHRKIRAGRFALRVAGRYAPTGILEI